jgi:hypothetical protein
VQDGIEAEVTGSSNVFLGVGVDAVARYRRCVILAAFIHLLSLQRLVVVRVDVWKGSWDGMRRFRADRLRFCGFGIHGRNSLFSGGCRFKL